MPTSPETLLEIARSYLAAEDQAQPLGPLGERYPDLTPADAIQIQEQLAALKSERGEELAGWKVGATNAAIQLLLKVPEPVYGRLYKRNQIPNGGALPVAELIHPRVECEIAFSLATDLAGPGAGIAEALAAVRGVQASIEINDPRTRDWKIGQLEVIADNGLAARYVLCDQLLPLAGLDLGALTVELRKNGQPVGTGVGSAVLGNPLNSLVWLANALALRGDCLRAGMVVLPGSLTSLVPATAGDSFEAEFEQLGAVSVNFV